MLYGIGLTNNVLLHIKRSQERLFGATLKLLAADGTTILQQQPITSAIGLGATFDFGVVPNVYFIRIDLPGAGQILTIAEIQARGFVL